MIPGFVLNRVGFDQDGAGKVVGAAVSGLSEPIRPVRP